MKIIKRFLCIILCFLLILNNINIPVFAGNFSNSSFYINNDGSTSFAKSIDDTFSIDITMVNNIGESIKDVKGFIDLGNLGFSYGEEQITRVNGANVNNPIPSSAWNDISSLAYQITNSPSTQIANGVSFGINRLSNDFWGFNIPNTVNTYSNTITVHFEAKKVSDSSAVIGDNYTKTLYVNVRPHITNYYFEKSDGSQTTSQVQGAASETINLILKVKDYNGCTNIDGGTVTANLAQIGLSATEPVSYASCEGDGKTAIFKKTGITTIVAAGTYTFNGSHFSAQDENSNINTLSDPNTTFSSEDLNTSLNLSVVGASSPTVSNLGLSETVIGSALKPSSLLTFSGSQNGQIKIVVGSDGNCVGGTVLQDWTGSGSYTAGTATGFTILASSLTGGVNSIYACIANMTGNTGSINVSVTKDTTAPTLSSIIVSPGNVTTNNSNLSFNCNENGFYGAEIGGNGTIGSGVGSTGWVAATANTSNTYAALNANLSAGINTLYGYCKDNAGNISFGSGTVTKIIPAISLSGAITSFADNDIDQDGLDGRDISLAWSNSGVVGSNFESYRIFILPSNITLNTATQTYSKLISSGAIASFTGDSSLTQDSTNASFVSGGSYKACIAIMGTDGTYGTAGCSTVATLTADTVAHPVITSAQFTTDTNLELTTNATLDTATGSFNGRLITYQIGATTYTGETVTSINAKKLNIAIPALGNLGATGGTLIIQTGAIRAGGGGYNDYFSSGTLAISDGQAPTITSLSTGTTSPYGGFYSGSIVLNYTFSEPMLGGGNSKIQFTRIGGNTDGSSPRIYNITSSSDLTSGGKTISLNLASIGLVSGAHYELSLVAKDLAGNSVTSSTISSIKFDNVGPVAPTITALTLLSTLTPTFNWVAPLDDLGNGSGIKQYNLSIYNGLSCTLTAIRTGTPTMLSYLLPVALPSNGADYSWKISATDNMDNVGASTSCDDFHVDTTVPVISSQKITDTTLSSLTYTKTNDSLSITANITNTDSGHIWADLSSLAGSAIYNNVLCTDPGTANITCSYVGGVVTYTFLAGFAGTVTSGTRQIQLRAQNISGLNDQTAIASITADNANPVISGSPITAPTTLSIWGGTTQNIIWTAGSITDNVALSSIKLEFSTGGAGGPWNLISNSANAGTYAWDISTLSSGANYQIKITAYDGVGNTTSTTSNTFSIDKAAPTLSSNTLTSPNGGGNYKGGQIVPIAWSNGSITDAGSFTIGLEYTLNNGTNWTTIGTGLVNNGSYNWTVPSSTNTVQAKIRLTATDSSTNASNDISDSSFIIDSIVPTLTMSYAGAGGTTPANGAKINNTGIDVSGTAGDSYLSGASYTFQNIGDGTYWNGSSWGGAQVWNSLTCAVGVSCTISQIVTPTGIIHDTTYRLILRSQDISGNATLANPIDYIGDIVNPTLVITTASGSYFSGAITIAGTASDAGSNISSTSLEIQKGASWWNGTTWVGTQQLLLTTTANSYANWSYNFNPSDDSSGQSYTIIAHAYDKTYKTNNTSTAGITTTKDTSGPIIAAGIFTHVISGIQKDGNIINITWNAGNITSTGAGIHPNGIVLKFNNGAGISTITGSTTNNGSYNYTLPTGDTQNAFFAIETYDTLGNISNTVSSTNFSLDSTPPTISSVETREDTLGQINGVNIYLSEPIAHSSIHLNDFSIPGVAGMQTGSITDVGSGTVFAINFTSTGTTAMLPSVTYILGALTDLSGKPLVTVTKAGIDKARPVILSADIYDTNSNGKVDRIIANVSESLTANTNTSSWSLGTPLAGVAISNASVSGSTVILTLTEPTSPNTSTGGMTLSFANNLSWQDSSNNLMSNTVSPLSLTDKAPPIKMSATTEDTNSNSKMDGILLVFSENITGALGNNFAVTGLSTGAIFSNSITSNGNTLMLNIGETTSDNDTSIAPAYSYSGTSVQDASNNALTNISSTSSTDEIKPKLMSRTTLDQDGNGYIDALKLLWSEAISGTGGITVSIGAGSYTNSGYTLCATNTLCALVTEKASYDGDQTPSIQITANTTLGDASGNVATTEGSSTNSIDGVGPIIIGARYDAGAIGDVNDDVVYLTFSESFSGSTINQADATTDFVLNGGGSLTSATVTNISGNTAEIHLGASSVALTPGTSQISIKTGAISDAISNISPTEGANNRTTVNASVVINEVMFSTTQANQYIELRNLGSTSVSLSGWTLANAGSFTLPADASIPGNGVYLIASTDPSSSLLTGAVIPDYITTLLNLSSITQTNILLKNPQNITFDSAKASPWPTGSGGLNISMERVNFPGDGLLSTNWYSAVASVGFDTPTPKGTPGASNVFDSTTPIISSVNITDNTLFPLGNISLVYNYSDNIGVDSMSQTFVVEKWTGASWSGVTLGNISSSGATSTQATYTTKTLPYGKYRSTFSISDTALNTTRQINIFYVDAFEMSISTGSVNIGTLSPGNITFASSDIIVTIKTLGAGFNLTIGGSGTMNAGIAQMASWSGTISKGYGFDWTESGSGNLKTYSNSLTAISPTVIGSSSLSPDVNGNQKIYIYTIKYGSKIDPIQSAGIYQSLANFGITLQY